MPDTPLDSAAGRRRQLLAWLVAAAAFLLVTAWACGRTGSAHHAGPELVGVLATSLPRALLWLAAAIGFGWPIRALLVPKTDAPLATQAALGAAALLALDAGLGRLWLAAAGAWALTVFGLALAVAQIVRHRRASLAAIAPWTLLPAAPAVAVLLVAAASAPGWLWASEFGGYDALSYHLQLPKEWCANGAITGLNHNVYSRLPSFMEAAYAHVMLLGGDPVHGAYACQLLHALLSVLAALVVARAAARRAGPLVGGAGGALVLGTPWTIVCGSLAYDEMAVALLLAGGLLLLDDDEAGAHAHRRAVALGLLIGAACGAKLTAAGFVAAPLLGLALLDGGGAARRLAVAAIAAATAMLVLAPWLLANALDTGNPLFPFAASILGSGPWSAEQVEHWRMGHSAPGGAGARLAGLWHEWLRYGIGPAPSASEPWAPQWLGLPWVALAAAGVGMAARATRQRAARLTLVLVVQIVFWVAFTHVKSRFMLPSIVPAALLVAVAARGIAPRRPVARRAAAAAGLVAVGAWCFAPAVIFAQEAGGRGAAAVGAIDVFTGDVIAARLARQLTDTERQALLAGAPPAAWINHLLGDDARVLCIGEAAPFYYRLDRIEYCTVWDRGPLSEVIAESAVARAWLAALGGRGYTHVLVDPTMLAVWRDAGWLADDLDVDAVLEAVEHLPRRRVFANGMIMAPLR